MTESQKFIKSSSHLLESAPDYFNFDSALMSPERFDTAKVKMLLVLPTPAITKSVSATLNVINDLFFSKLDDCYLDVAYLPTKDDIKIFDKYLMPYAIGHQTHLDPSHFDIVGFSISVLHEILTIPVIIKSFSRCDRPVSLTWTERKDKSLSETPVLIAGGITAAQSDLCFGELGDGRQAFLDGIILGQDDALVPIINKLSVTSKSTTVQDFLDTCFESPHFYQPQAYRVTYKDNLIVENVKINPKAQDWVSPMYEKSFEKRLYVARTVVQGTGSNAGNTQIQLSEGAVAKGTIVTTNRGLLKIENIGFEFQEVAGLKSLNLEGAYDILEHHSLGVMETLKIYTKSGLVMEVTPNHPMHQWDLFHGESFKQAEHLVPGDFLSIPILSDIGDKSYPDWVVYALGTSVAKSVKHYIPEVVWSMDTNAKLQFLLGFLNNSGTVTKNYVRFISQDLEFIQDLKILVWSVGVIGFIGVPQNSVDYYLDIFGDSVGKFFSLVGAESELPYFLDTVPVEYWEWHQFIIKLPLIKDKDYFLFDPIKDKLPRFLAEQCGFIVPDDIYFDEILKIVPSQNEVYDLSVDSVERYIANGVLVHNCTGGKGMCSFCSEGSYSGAWVENPIENIKWAARESKRYCAADSCKPLSFNI